MLRGSAERESASACGACAISMFKRLRGCAESVRALMSVSGTPPSERGLTGRGLLQSEAEWDARNRVLAESLAGLVHKHATPVTGRALDVGCQSGALTDALARITPYAWLGVDPGITAATRSPEGTPLEPGSARNLPGRDESYDCLLFANVYEHIDPQERMESLSEMRRVLRSGGVVVGQLPNPYFPIESHSRLPFMGWLPRSVQHRYWCLSPVPWEHDFYVVTVKQLQRTARDVGFETVLVRNFNYPLEVIPQSVRRVAHVLERPMRWVPWAWQFVLRSP